MILDVPTPADFSVSGVDFLNIAWSTASQLTLGLTEYESFSVGDHEPDQAQYWLAAQRPLATALSLVQQGAEFLLKGKISGLSPYLLLAGDPGEWASRSMAKAKRFSDFKTIDAQHLIGVYSTVSGSNIDAAYVSRFDQLRSRRNTIMHTVDTGQAINDMTVYVEILEACHHLIRPQGWQSERREYLSRDADSTLWPPEVVDYDIATLMFNRELPHIIGRMTRGQAKKYFGHSKAQRQYLCPECNFDLADHMAGESRMSVLRPNTKVSKNVYCLLCGNDSKVDRTTCGFEDCPGNVIAENDAECLTCGRSQYELDQDA